MHKITVEYLDSQGLSEDFPSRFFEKVNITPGCWYWTGFRRRTQQPYGDIYRGLKVRGSYMILAHKASWILHFGPIPKGLCVCHDCPDGDCPYCVNPAHLWLGTDSENFLDMWNKGRANIVTAYFSGERNHNSILTDALADEIRKLYKPRWNTASMLAKQFNVPVHVVKNLLRAKSYRNTGAKPIPVPRHKLSPEQEQRVRGWYAAGGVSQQTIADFFHVSQLHISNIVRHKY